MKKLDKLLLATGAMAMLCGGSAFAQEFDDFGDFGDFGGDTSSESAASPKLQASGEASVEVRSYFNKADTSDADNAGDVELKALPKGKINLEYDGSMSDLSLVIKMDEDTIRNHPQDVIDELTVRGYFGSFVLEAGKMKLVWGKGDKLHVIDNFNADDYTDFIMPDYLDRRIATPIIRGSLSFPVGNLNLEGVYTPFLPTDRFATKGRWAPAQFTATKNLLTEIEKENVSRSYKKYTELTATAGTLNALYAAQEADKAAYAKALKTAGLTDESVSAAAANAALDAAAKQEAFTMANNTAVAAAAVYEACAADLKANTKAKETATANATQIVTDKVTAKITNYVTTHTPTYVPTYMAQGKSLGEATELAKQQAMGEALAQKDSYTVSALSEAQSDSTTKVADHTYSEWVTYATQYTLAETTSAAEAQTAQTVATAAKTAAETAAAEYKSAATLSAAADYYNQTLVSSGAYQAACEKTGYTVDTINEAVEKYGTDYNNYLLEAASLASDPSSIYPDTNVLKYGQAGARLTGTVGMVDWGVSYYYGHYKQPSINYEPYWTSKNDGSEYLALPTFDYDRKQTVGLEASTVLWHFNVRGEAAYNFTDDMDGTNPWVHNNSIQWLGGFDIDLPIWNMNLNVQEYGTYILHGSECDKTIYDESNSIWDVDYNKKGYTNNKIVANVTASFDHDKILPEVTAMYGIERGDLVLMPKITFKPADGLSLYADGMYVWTKDDDSEFRAWKNNSFVQLGAKYQF